MRKNLFLNKGNSVLKENKEQFMLITTKTVQIIFVFLTLITILNSIFAQTLNAFYGSAGLVVLLIVAIYFLQKYITKKSTQTELKIYKSRIYQLILSCWGLLHMVGYYYSINRSNSGLIHVAWITAVLIGIVAIQKHITKIKLNESI